jgi:hypothetical protein
MPDFPTSAKVFPTLVDLVDSVLALHQNERADEIEALEAYLLAGIYQGIFALSGVLSPAQITGNQNNYNPTGLSTASVLRLTSDAARDITGLAGGSAGRILFIHNVGGFAITLKDESGSSTAGNRFALTADATLSPDSLALLVYDDTSQRWRILIGGGAAAFNGDVTGAFTLSGDISPSQITANQNDYAPTGFATASVLRLSTDASRNITGLAGGADGRVIVIVNIGAQPIVLIDESGSSTAGNRFALTGDLVIGVDQMTVLLYDGTSSRWRSVRNVASAAAPGDVELATSAEINTGTDTTRAMPVDQFVASNRNVRYVLIRVLDKDTDWPANGTTGVGGDFECPITGTIVEIGAYDDVAGTTGVAVVDVNKNGATLMTTNKLSFDSTEKTTRTAATQPTLTTTAIAAGDLLTVDVDTNHTTKAKGLTIRLGIRLT